MCEEIAGMENAEIEKSGANRCSGKMHEQASRIESGTEIIQSDSLKLGLLL